MKAGMLSIQGASFLAFNLEQPAADSLNIQKAWGIQSFPEFIFSLYEYVYYICSNTGETLLFFTLVRYRYTAISHNAVTPNFIPPFAINTALVFIDFGRDEHIKT